MTLLAGRFDLSRCPRVARTLRNWGLYEEDGTRHFLSRSAMRNWSEFSPRPEDASSGYQTAAHIAPLPYNIAVELTRRLRKDGTLTISLDLDDHDLAGSVDVNAITKLLGETDLFLPSLQGRAYSLRGSRNTREPASPAFCRAGCAPHRDQVRNGRCDCSCCGRERMGPGSCRTCAPCQCDGGRGCVLWRGAGSLYERGRRDRGFARWSDIGVFLRRGVRSRRSVGCDS